MLAAASVFVGLMLLVNRRMVISLCALLPPPGWDDPRVRTLLQVFLTVGLVLPEWWLLDRVFHALHRWHRGP